MAVHDKLKIRYAFENQYKNTAQLNWVGAQAEPYKRGWWHQAPALNSGAVVTAAVRIGRILYCVGQGITNAGGVARVNAFAFDMLDGALMDWAPDMQSGDGFCIAKSQEQDGSWSLYIGKALNAIKVDSVGGTTDAAWLPAADGTVTKIIVRNANSILVAGSFDNIGGQARLRVAELNGTNGAATALDPHVNGPVYAIYYDSEADQLYIGGRFEFISLTARNNIGRYNVGAGSLDSWDPNLNAGFAPTCYAIAFRSSSSIYLAGQFDTINGGTTRNNLCEVDGSGTVTAFDPDVDDVVRCLALDSDGNLYAGGQFAAVGATARSRAASWDSDNALRDWDPDFSGAGIQSMTIEDRTVFCLGSFSADYIGTIQGIDAVPNIIFTDANSIFISKLTGDDANAGTQAAPLKSLEGAIGVTPSYLDVSGNGNHPTMNGTVFIHPRGYTDIPFGRFMAGPFSDSNYYQLPTAIGTAIAASGSFTVRAKFYPRTLNVDATVWKYKDGANTSLILNLDGSIGFQLRGTTLTTAPGIFSSKKWSEIKIAYAYDAGGASVTKRIWLNGVLVASASQTAVMGAHIDNEIGRNVDSAAHAFDGFINDFEIYDEYQSEEEILDKTNLVAAYPFQSASIAKTSNCENIVFIDSEVYEEPSLDVHIPGLRIVAADGCAPTIKPAKGAVPGTYGARKIGREKFSLGSGTTFYYVSKDGDDSTGTRGDEELPFLTVQAALDDGSRIAGDTIQIEDSNIYREFISIGSLDVTIQAADGQTPTLVLLQQLSHSTTMLDIYGIVVSGKGMTCPFQAWDCTFADGDSFIQAASSAVSRAVNCSFLKVTLQITGTPFEATNCYFSGFASQSSQSQIANSVGSMKRCTFADGAVLVVTGSTNYKGFLLSNCYFFNNPAIAGSTLNLRGSGATRTLISVIDCVFENCATGIAMVPGSGGDACFMALDNCFFRSTISAYGFKIDNTGASGAGYYAIRNCASIGATADCFKSSYTGSFTAETIFKGCIAINAGVYGFDVPAGPLNNFIEGCLEQGSGTGSVFFTTPGDPEDPVLGVTYSFLGTATAGSVTLDSNSAIADPDFMSIVVGAENIALAPSSPGILLFTPFNGEFSKGAQSYSNCGRSGALVEVCVDSCKLDGIFFEGSKNDMGALRFRKSFPSQSGEVIYCSFINTGNEGIFALRGNYSSNKFYGCFGNGIEVVGENSVLRNNTGVNIAGALILNGSAVPEIRHNSSFAAYAGQYDFKLLGGDYAANIFSASGSFDYVGGSEQGYSDIESLSPDARIDANSVQKNPLYQDPYNGDLRLHALALGYSFDSPAKGLAEDGTDAGAFLYYYGPLTLCYIEIDFNEAGWYNPDDMPETRYAAFVAEGDKPQGSAYSSASGYKRQWELKWNTTNPMPHNQRNALEQMYVFPDADIQITFDGGTTWIEATLMKSEPFVHDEVTGQYTQDDTPRPIASLLVRER